MDVTTVFRNLVNNHYMPEFDYVQTCLSFQTLFYKSAYSYCCCSCGFEHEYFLYINDTMQVDEVMYKKVLQNILNGRCPHVIGKPQEYVTESCVYAIQIAAVVGTELAVEEHFKEYLSIRGGGIFKLRAGEIATLRKNYESLVLCCNELPKLAGILSGWKTPLPPVLLPSMQARNNCTSQTRVEIVILEQLEYFIKDRNSTVLRGILVPSIFHEHIEKAFKLIFKYHETDMVDSLCGYYGHLLNKGVYDFPDNCAEPAIVYNQPTVLNRILNSRTSWSTETQRRLVGTCSVLERTDCETVLSQHNFLKLETETEPRKMSRLLALLAEFYDDFKDEIIFRIKNIPGFQEVINVPITQTFPEKRYWTITPLTPLQYYIEKSISVRKLDCRVVQTMLDLGAGVEACGTIIPPNGHALRSEYWSTVCSGDQISYRKTLEVLLNENPKLASNTEAVKIGVQLDVYLKMPKMHDKVDLTGEYLMDGREHSLFGHEDRDSYPCNFIGPLLIECGFPYTKDVLLFAMEKSLHPSEHLYIQECLETPRSLKLSCRDTLRKRYQGREIHKFVEKSNIPVAIKDFILMKSLLRNL